MPGVLVAIALSALLAAFPIYGLAASLEAKRRTQRLWVSTCMATAIVYAYDALTGGKLSLNTPFGYSSFYGGRYYGLGNVGMGLALGASFGLGLALERRWLAALLCAFGTVLVGAPFWGANIGGALTGAVLTATVIGAGRWRWWHLFLAVLLTLALLGAFAAFELLRPEPMTHWGRFVHTLRQEGLGTGLSIVWTKLGISFRAFRGIHWNIAFAGMAVLILALWLRGERDWKLLALTIGSAAALLLNDSGPQTPVAFAFLPLCVLAAKSVSG